MVMLVSLNQASDHLRRDTTDDNSDLELKIAAASQAVLNYVKGPFSFLDTSGQVEVDSAGDPVGVPEPMQMAVLMVIGMLYTDRQGQDYIEGGKQPRLGDISLPRAVHWLLDPLRKPTLA